MSLDIFFAEDIRNALLAANEASAATAAVITEVRQSPTAKADQGDLLTVTLRAYREGYKAALATVALAFGLSPEIVAGQGNSRSRQALQVEPPTQIEVLVVDSVSNVAKHHKL